MSNKSTKVERLVRLRQFREELAEGDLRQALAEHGKAEAEHARSVDALDRLGAWKAQRVAEGGLDVGIYQAVLAMEQHGMRHAETLRVASADRQQRADAARRHLGDAVASTRVAQKRDSRERTARAASDEKRLFDQISEQWLGHREKPRD